MSHLVFDVETTTKNKGHPFTQSNKLCLVGLKNGPLEDTLKIQYDDEPFGANLKDIQSEFNDQTTTFIGFNAKFDLHWLRRYGIKFPRFMRVHDCQLAYFIETAQQYRYPSLNEAAAHYGLPPKLDVVEKEYWSKGIDTPDVPFSILQDYLLQDLRLTEAIYLKQVEFFEKHPKLRRLFRLQCQDLIVLQEMEWNGLLYDVEASKKRSTELEARMSDIRDSLSGLVGDVPVNWDSGDHVSSVLYGGTIEEQVREPYLFTYADPKKEPVWKEKWITRTYSLTRLTEPLKGSQLQKDGKWQTGGAVLSELRAVGKAKVIISLLLEYADVSKARDYFHGIPKLIEEMEWEDNILHGNLNQCNVVTGRLSSNKPNQQNMPEDVQDLIRSRYESQGHPTLV